ncbi:MAG: HEAT repeat domain-containing protein [Vicinamibacteria bacterium]|nr:HEAT repeat domain-containing protein [Vicinamibacteria bacterium]
MIGPCAALLLIALGAPGWPGAADEGESRVRALAAMLGTREAVAGIEGLVAVGAPAVPVLVEVARLGGRRGGDACAALARIGTPDALDAVDAATRSEDVSVRRGALAALGHVGAERSVLTLAAAVRGDPDRRARQIAAGALGRIGSEAAVLPLVAALRDEWEWVRAEAAEALGRLRTPLAVEGLAQALHDGNWEVCLRARRALAEVGAPAVGRLRRALDDAAPERRWPVAWVLGQIGGDAAWQALEGLRDDPDWRLRNEAAAAAARRAGRHSGDFPTLARTGLHAESELESAVTITGRSLAEITDLGRPEALSAAGFMAADEDVQSVLIGDNRLVAALGLTHLELARPMLHVSRRIQDDCRSGRWDAANHRWNQGPALPFDGRVVSVEARDTKGGQESIFDDGLTGAFWIRVRRELTPDETRFLKDAYPLLAEERRAVLAERLTTIQTGELQPEYIRRYGFYEGHTEWRVDPLAVAFVFGLRTLSEIEAACPGRLDEALLAHFTR